MSKITKSLEESYQAYLAEQQEAQIEQLACYQAISEWLKSAYRQPGFGRPDRDKLEQVEKILDLCAQLVTADTRDWEELISQIEEELR